MGRLRTTSCKQAKMRRRETVMPKRGNVPVARQPFTTTPAFRLSRRPTDLALKSSPLPISAAVLDFRATEQPQRRAHMEHFRINQCDFG